MHQQKLNDIIHLTDIIEKLPPLIRKVPHLLSGLKQAYLRTPETPTGLGIAFEKPFNKIHMVWRYYLKNKDSVIENSMNGPIKLGIFICRWGHVKAMSLQ